MKKFISIICILLGLESNAQISVDTIKIERDTAVVDTVTINFDLDTTTLKTLINLLENSNVLPEPKKISFLKPVFQKNDWVIYTAQFIAGLADGVREEVLYHPNAFFRKYPNLNRQYWDSRISWENKVGKSKLFTPISDANHTLRLIIQTSNLVSISFSFGELSKYPKNQRWKVIAKKMILSYAANKAGFATSYYAHFNN